MTICNVIGWGMISLLVAVVYVGILIDDGWWAATLVLVGFGVFASWVFLAIHLICA